MFWAFLGLYFLDRTAEEQTGYRGERERDDMQQRATDRIEPEAAVARTQPLYMGRLLYQLSHQAPLPFFFNVNQTSKSVSTDLSFLPTQFKSANKHENEPQNSNVRL